MVFLAHKALHPNVVQRDDGSTVAALPGSARDSCPPSVIAALREVAGAAAAERARGAVR